MVYEIIPISLGRISSKNWRCRKSSHWSAVPPPGSNSDTVRKLYVWMRLHSVVHRLLYVNVVLMACNCNSGTLWEIRPRFTVYGNILPMLERSGCAIIAFGCSGDILKIIVLWSPIAMEFVFTFTVVRFAHIWWNNIGKRHVLPTFWCWVPDFAFMALDDTKNGSILLEIWYFEVYTIFRFDSCNFQKFPLDFIEVCSCDRWNEGFNFWCVGETESFETTFGRLNLCCVWTWFDWLEVWNLVVTFGT